VPAARLGTCAVSDGNGLVDRRRQAESLAPVPGRPISRVLQRDYPRQHGQFKSPGANGGQLNIGKTASAHPLLTPSFGPPKSPSFATSTDLPGKWLSASPRGISASGLVEYPSTPSRPQGGLLAAYPWLSGRPSGRRRSPPAHRGQPCPRRTARCPSPGCSGREFPSSSGHRKRPSVSDLGGIPQGADSPRTSPGTGSIDARQRPRRRSSRAGERCDPG
jgi:hypothetical protein